MDSTTRVLHISMRVGRVADFCAERTRSLSTTTAAIAIRSTACRSTFGLSETPGARHCHSGERLTLLRTRRLGARISPGVPIKSRGLQASCNPFWVQFPKRFPKKYDQEDCRVPRYQYLEIFLTRHQAPVPDTARCFRSSCGQEAVGTP